MSNKIRFAGLIVAAVILIAGLSVACSLSSTRISQVDAVKVVNTTDNSAEISWKNTRNADGYYLYEKKSADSEYEKVATVEDGKQNSYIIENLEDSTVYDLYVNAYKNLRKKTVESKEYSAISLCTLPARQNVKLFRSAAGEFEITLDENSKANGYKIEYSQNSDFSDSQSETIDDVTEIVNAVGELEVGKEYYFRACSYVNFEDKELYGEWSDTVSDIAPDEESLNEVDPSKPMIAITFDDGPGYNSAGERILDVIEKYHIKATFFMLGKNASDNPDNVKRKAALGCELGNHTYDHKNYGKKVTPSDIKKGTDAISEAGGDAKVTSFRSPGGNTTPAIREECKNEGLALYYWSLDTMDWKVRDADKVYDAVMNNVKDGDIVLMHEIYPSTAEAFEKMVPELIKQGYQLVTCEQLIRAKIGSQPEAGTQYVRADKIKNDTN